MAERLIIHAITDNDVLLVAFDIYGRVDGRPVRDEDPRRRHDIDLRRHFGDRKRLRDGVPERVGNFQRVLAPIGESVLRPARQLRFVLLACGGMREPDDRVRLIDRHGDRVRILLSRHHDDFGRGRIMLYHDLLFVADAVFQDERIDPVGGNCLPAFINERLTAFFRLHGNASFERDYEIPRHVQHPVQPHGFDLRSVRGGDRIRYRPRDRHRHGHDVLCSVRDFDRIRPLVHEHGLGGVGLGQPVRQRDARRGFVIVPYDVDGFVRAAAVGDPLPVRREDLRFRRDLGDRERLRPRVAEHIFQCDLVHAPRGERHLIRKFDAVRLAVLAHRHRTDVPALHLDRDGRILVRAASDLDCRRGFIYHDRNARLIADAVFERDLVYALGDVLVIEPRRLDRRSVAGNAHFQPFIVDDGKSSADVPDAVLLDICAVEIDLVFDRRIPCEGIRYAVARVVRERDRVYAVLGQKFARGIRLG